LIQYAQLQKIKYRDVRNIPPANAKKFLTKLRNLAQNVGPIPPSVRTLFEETVGWNVDSNLPMTDSDGDKVAPPKVHQLMELLKTILQLYSIQR
jgi:hypothetical protein